MSTPNHLENEQQILNQIADGDQQAFRVLYMHYYDRLFKFAMMFLRTEPASEDVVADVFFVLWKNRITLTHIPSFHTYIYHAVRNGCLNVLKSSYNSKRSDLTEPEMQICIEPDTPLDDLSYKELHKAVNDAVHALPERCRIIFKMAKEDNMNHNEIANILNIKLCTVERQLLLAKSRIKNTILPFLEKF